MIVFYYNIGPSFIGHISIQQQADYQYTAIWDFSDLNDYNYDDSLIEVNTNEAKLKQTTTIYEWQEEIITGYNVEKAFYTLVNKTDEIRAVDDKKLHVNKNVIFDVFFDGSIDNGCIINLYLKDSSSSDIYLCRLSEQCESPGYGIAYFDGGEAWFNITVSSLSSPINGFNIEADNVKFDYINATRIEYITHTEENISYPLSAEIETDDHIIENLKSFDAFSYEHELNSNSIEYYYSVDSGESWNLIEDSNLSSVDTSNNKISFKAILYSDQTSTPVLGEMRLGYTVLCIEDWNIQYGECSTADAKIKFYTDANSCGTTANLPEDNGSYVECDYCAPEWHCNSYGACQQNNTKTCAALVDSNNCSAITGLESDLDYSAYENYTAECVYDNATPLLTTKTVINSTDSNTIIEISSAKTFNSAISVVGYSANPVNFTAEKISAGKYVEIVEENASSNLSSVIIKVYYNETEINSLNIEESSLKLYYFNESSLEWQVLESFVNTDENYVYVNLTHLSLFGMYGDEIQNQSTIIEEDISDESEETSPAADAGKRERLNERKMISEPAQDFEEREEEKDVAIEEEAVIVNESIPSLIKTKPVTQPKNVDDEVIGLVIIAVFAIIMILVSTKKKKINKQTG